MLSTICEEFGCLPSAAAHEPLSLAIEIIEWRHFSRAKAACDRATADEERPQGYWGNLVTEIEFEHKEELFRQKQAERIAKKRKG